MTTVDLRVPTTRYRCARVTRRVGIVTCAGPAGPWELCRRVRVATLDELAAAVQPARIPDHGVPAPEARVSDAMLDGELAVVVQIQAYEHPARGGQELAYIVAMHDGRPYLLRIHTSRDKLQDLELIIAAFRFVDRP